MKLHPSSRKEIKRISIGVVICDSLMIALLFLLSQFGLGTFTYRIFVGALGGSLVTILNFIIMCLTVQKATNYDDQRRMKAFFQASYNGRLMLQAVWVIVCFAVPHIHVVAGAVPLLFPSVIILHLQVKGKLLPPDPLRDPSRPNPLPQKPERENGGQHPGPFEI